MKRPVLLLLLAVGFAHAFAGGPVYSRYGIGDLIWFGSSRSFAMGGLGYALNGDGFINIANPAGISRISFTRFDGSFSYNSFWSRTANGASGAYWRSGLQNLALAIPIDTSRGIVMSLEAAPYSSVGYNSQRTVSQSGIVTTQTFTGTGGLGSISLGASVHITRDLSLGAKASYLYGRTQQFLVIDFQNASFTDDQQDRSIYHTAALFTVGSIWSVGKTAFLPGRLNLGLSVSLPANVSLEQVNAFKTLDTVLTSTGSMTIPLRIGAGASLAVSDRLTAIADVGYQDWSSVAGIAPASLTSALRFSAGCELMPEKNELSYFNRIGYRIGAGFEQSYVSISGQRINDIFGTAGLSLPLGPGRLNITGQVGVRGTLTGGLQKDTYLQLNIGMTSDEIWFMELRED